MRLFTVAQRGGYAPMIGGLGYVVAPGAAAYRMNTLAGKDVWVQTPQRVTAERTPTISVELASPGAVPSPTGAVSSPRVLADLFWMGRYAERAEGTARLLTVTRERYHEYRYRRDVDESQCVPVLLAAVGSMTGTDTGDHADVHEMVAIAPSTLWSATADRHRPGSLAQSVESLGLAARAVRDQMSNDTWMVLAGVERAVLRSSVTPPQSPTAADGYLSTAHSRTLAGMLALSGVAAESMVHDIGWTMMDLGKRIERGLALTALLRTTMTTMRAAAAERAPTESSLVVCESSVIYRRRNPGQFSGRRGRRTAALRCGEPQIVDLPAGAHPFRPQAPARIIGFVAGRTPGRRTGHPAAPGRPGRPRGRRGGRHPNRIGRSTRRCACRSS